MGNQCITNPGLSPPPSSSNRRRNTFTPPEQAAAGGGEDAQPQEFRIDLSSPAKKNPHRKRFFIPFTALNSPARSTMSSTSASDTPQFRDIIKTASSLSLNRRYPSGSPMHLDQPAEDTDDDDDEEKENSSDSEPYYLGNSRDEYHPNNKSFFGVEEDFRQLSKRFRTKRFRSRLELGIM